MKAKGSQMERLIQAAGGAPADGSQVRSKYQTAGQMERLIEAMGGGGGSAPFVVTLSPTAADFSGAMDKTGAEISQAYAAGRKIVFNVLLDANGSHMEVPPC